MRAHPRGFVKAVGRDLAIVCGNRKAFRTVFFLPLRATKRKRSCQGGRLQVRSSCNERRRTQSVPGRVEGRVTLSMKEGNMRNLSKVLPLLLVSVLVGCGGSNETSTSEQRANPAASAQQGSGTQPGNASKDDPQNPWVLGFRWSGPVGTEFRVRVASRNVNYDRLKSGGQQAYTTTRRDLKVQDDHNVYLASSYIEGLKLRATIRNEGGPLKIEMVEGRLADRQNPLGAAEVRKVLSTGEASGKGGVIELEAGKPFEVSW